MLKKLTLIFLAAVMALCALGANAEETYQMTPGFVFTPGERYDVSYDAEEDIFMIYDRQNVSLLVVTCVDISEFGVSGKLFMEALDGAKGGTVPFGDNSAVITSGVLERGGIPYFTFQTTLADGTFDGLYAISDSYMVCVIAFVGSLTDAEEMLDFLSPTGAKAAPVAKEEVADPERTTEDIAGFYDLYTPLGLDTDINLILTPMGFGRMINSSSSATFVFTVENGKIIPDVDAFELTVTGENQVSMKMESIGIDFTFQKRADVADPSMVGVWKATKVRSGFSVLDEKGMRAQGISVDIFVYPNGSIDWHAITDSDSWVAQGWGADGQGLYMKNGDSVMRCTIDGDQMDVVMNSQGRSFTYTFTRVSDGETGQDTAIEPQIFSYTVLSDGTACVTGLKQNVAVLRVPAEIDGYPVTRIGASAFRDADFTAAYIPEGVEVIESGAFNRCSDMTVLSLPESLHTIGSYAFMYCNGIQELHVPDGIKLLETGAFQNMNGLKTVWLPDGITYMDGVFEHCLELETVYLPDGMLRLPPSIFQNCYKLKEVHFGSQIRMIGDAAFFGCEGLTEMTLPDTVTAIESQGFYSCENLKRLVIPAGVTAIADSAFDWCEALTLIVAEGSYAEEYAASKGIPYETYQAEVPEQTPIDTETEFTSGLYTYKLLEDGSARIVKYLGDEEDVTIPSQLDGAMVTVIGTQAFLGCDAKSLTMPETLRVIEWHACDMMWKCTSIHLNEGLKTIGGYAFYLCSTLEEINIPLSVREIGVNPFFGCYSMRKLQLDTPIQFFRNVRGSVYALEDRRLVYYIPSEGQETYLVSGDVEIIDAGAFAFSELREIILPDGLKKIENSAFRDCRQLSGISFPSSLEKIGSSLFLNCERLESAALPECAVKIDAGMFKGCKSLRFLVIPESVTEIEEGAFQDAPNLTLYVVKDSYAHQYAVQHQIAFEIY